MRILLFNDESNKLSIDLSVDNFEFIDSNLVKFNHICFIYPIYWNQMPHLLKKLFDEVIFNYDKSNDARLKGKTFNTVVSIGNSKYLTDTKYYSNLSYSLHELISNRLKMTPGEFIITKGSSSIPSEENLISRILDNHRRPKLAITSMYANPIHPGHIECLSKSKLLADKLIVIVNNDAQVDIKGSKKFLNEVDRLNIVSNIKSVDEVVLSEDTDGSVVKTLEKLILKYKDDYEIIFTKGGDRFADNIPEKLLLDSYGIKIIDGLGDKTHSSSELLKDANDENLVLKPWGSYRVIESGPNYKLKEIKLNPYSSISVQSHNLRNETWRIINGKGYFTLGKSVPKLVSNSSDALFIPKYYSHHIRTE